MAEDFGQGLIDLAEAKSIWIDAASWLNTANPVNV